MRVIAACITPYNPIILMLSEERRNLILEALSQTGSVRVSELAASLNADPVTIRRDLAQLESEGRLHRVHGGAVRREGSASSPASSVERRIAETAARFIPDDTVVFLGPGALTAEMVPFLTGHQRLTLVTNSLHVAWAAARGGNHTVHVVGGQVEADLGLYGDMQALPQLRADWVVLEASGLDAERGLTHDQSLYANLARALFGLGAQMMALLLPERIGRTGAVYIAPADEVDMLITGREASNAALWDLSELGMRVVLT